MRQALKTFLAALVPNVVQVTGLGLVGCGFFLISPCLGFIVTGLMVCVIGWALENGGDG